MLFENVAHADDAVVPQIAAGYYHSVGLVSDGTVWSWGRGNNGQLGNGESVSRAVPRKATGLSSVKSITGGVRSSFATLKDGTVMGWGANGNGQLGDGTTTDRLSPVQVSALSNIKAISGGTSYHTLALDGNGNVWAWGRNDNGDLGDGTTIQRNTPVQVNTLSNVKAIAAGGYFSLALKEDGTVWSWGWNGAGQLGNGTTNQRILPEQVPGLSHITAIAAGGNHSLALDANGRIWAWGENRYGALGDGTTTNRTAPVLVSGLTNATTIAGGNYHSLALDADGQVYAWGYNSYGQLGDGTTTQRNIPVLVPDLSKMTAIAGGGFHSFAMRSDGMVWSWGYNADGELGDNTAISRSLPVKSSAVMDATAPSINNGMISASSTTSTSTTLTWVKATDNMSDQSALQYLVYQSESNNIQTVAQMERYGKPIGAYTQDIEKLDITSLKPGTKYYFNIIVKDQAGYKSAYGIKQITTNSVYSISYIDNGSTGGSVPVDSNTYEQGTSITIKENSGNLIKEGHTFIGWNTQADGKGTSYAANTSFTVGVANVKLYANWKANSYTVSYAAGMNGTISATSETVAYGNSPAAVPMVTPNIGYMFAGWSSDGGTTKLTSAQVALTTVTADIAYTAYYTQNSYTVSYAAGANGTISAASETVAHGNSPAAVPTVTPTTGYTFAGWSSDGGTTKLTSTQVALTTVTADIAYTAYYTQNSYTVSYAAGANGTISATSETVVYGNSPAAVPTVTPTTGYTFAGWSSDGGSTKLTSAQVALTTVTADITYTAYYTQNSYTVSYAAGAKGTISAASETVAYGNSPAAVPTVTPTTGYTFAGWSSDGGTTKLTSAQVAATTVTADITYTAYYTQNSYTVSYVAGANGTISATSETVAYGNSPAAVPTVTPTTGYTFAGWSSDGGTTKLTSAQVGSTTVTADITYTAYYTQNSYTVSYAAGANGTISATSETVAYGNSPIAVPTVTPATGYTFAGWSSDGGTTKLTSAQVALTTVTADITYTAYYTQNSYTVSYAAGAKGTISATSETVAHGNSPAAVPTVTPSTGYTFVGWSSDGGTTKLTNMQIAASTVTADITYTAYYTQNSYTVSYAAGTNGTISATSETVAYGNSPAAVPTVTPTTGYMFAGWSSDGGTTKLTSAQVTLTTVTADITYTAYYTQNSYTVSYAAGANGTISAASETVAHGNSPAAVPTVTPSIGYTFAGWSSDGGITKLTSTQVAATTVTADITYTAYYTQNSYTVSYAAGANGTISATSETVAYGNSPAAVPPVTPNIGYTFAGWSSDGGTTKLTSAQVGSTTVTAEITYTAYYTQISYTVSYAAGANGKIIGNTSQTVISGADGTEVKAVPDAGYNFVKWSDDVATATRTDSNVTANVYVTAYFAIMAQVAVPTANPTSGEVTSGTSVTLSTYTAGASIYFTTDGSIPTIGSMAYSKSISVMSAMTIRAIAFKAGMADSPLMRESYTIVEPEPLNSTISPRTGSFDKMTTAQTDVTTTLMLNGNNLSSIVNDTTKLMSGMDYTMSGNMVTIKKSYLANKPVGTTSLTFNFSAGTSQTLAITVRDTTIAIPGVPLLEPAVAGNAQISLKWNPVVGSTGYKVYQSVTSSTYGAEVANVSGSVYSYDVTGLKNGTTYYFVVKAVNPGGDSASSNEVSAIPQTVPGAPTDIIAIAGNGQVTVTFTAPVDNGGSKILRYEVTASPGNVTVTGMASPIIITNLSNGTPYTITVNAINSMGSSEASRFSSVVTPRSSSRNGTSSAPIQPTTPSTADIPNEKMDVLIDGIVEDIGVTTTTTINNQTITTTVLDQEKLDDKLTEIGQHAVVAIRAKTISDIVVFELNGQMVRSMEQKQAVIEIKTDNASYTLPAQQININTILDQLAKTATLKDIKVEIEIATPSTETAKLAENSAAIGEFVIIAPPLNFSVRATYGDNKLDVTKFNAYVERTIVVPDGVDPNKITTGVIIDPEGTVRHVPTKITVIDGKYYAIMNSMTNSTYAIVWHPLVFTDAAQHWAKDTINDMGSRMVISGVGNGMFNPDKDITRAEFAAIIVRGLGLKLDNGTASFSDMNSSDWFSGAIQTAYGYKLINGFEDGTFRPMDKITREQAMSIVAKAMTLTGLKAKLPSQEDGKQLTLFADANNIAEWARSSVADCLQARLVSGRSSTQLASDAFITRSEVAVIIQKLLQKSDLIH
ncbi:InlB B-repeat-containing protein [Paenibacillus sp. N5-1-1-5]|uniref:InlB B-repeat-containing protein n=2 Tax=Paenibacillus radicis (ex Xue et al. 2023) TaxID=2972489 RepID=A0ABT1YEH7_9BACL|nr:InlB B-repeat-containing protein [Paenibacillus radicis (ex Xue et al. 2023)]MCR8630375.1 InlB B-repeat-containing protein [Paenibacillus radicis (ex Xue et al. 2023)]